MTQTPPPNDFLLRWRGDILTVTLKLDAPRKGRAAFRTNLFNAPVRRAEIIAETERGETPMARAWTDIPMKEVESGLFRVDIPLDEVGVFSGKACFFAEGSSVPEWPEGNNTHVKVESAETRKNCSIYTVFPRQFGSFREIVRRLPIIMDTMGFRIVQTLPPFPVPTTYAVMGEYGCPFAALDFMNVDPAMAEFDEYATPLDQFLELVEAVHARRGLMLIDLPANHTGWASTLQTHHPDWFHRATDGRFISPGAWGVTWADLVELDYSNPELRAYMADVFLFWCRNGVDGFRCDAGYMIPAETWDYIVARVRDEYPDTIFMLEGLGGPLDVTDRLLAVSNLDWAYSEIFQTYDRGAFEWYLPGAIKRSEKFGTLVHFAETHDNDRLAKGGNVYARLRVQLSALLSWQGAWGMANGVEWYCREKIDVHGKNDLNWGAKENMVDLIARLNHILKTNASFVGASHLEVVTRGEGNTLAVLRSGDVLVLANLDCRNAAVIDWDRTRFAHGEAFDLITERKVATAAPVRLAPGEVMCLQGTPAAAARDSLNYLLSENPLRKKFTAHFHWVFPRDVNRVIVVPEGEWVKISAPYHFRMRLIDPETGKTIRAYRSHPTFINSMPSTPHRCYFDAPHHYGEGTRCRRLRLVIIAYRPGKAIRKEADFLVPPNSKNAKVRLAMNAREVYDHPEYRTILSNGAGAASQMRVGWGEIASQYDATLAANPNANCPSDRLNLWARTRCWLQREGYTREFDRRCTSGFVADPAGRFARWNFRVPCGMGKDASFVFEVALARGKNAARVVVERVPGGDDDVGDQVRLVFRPDIEWRSFHATTKAYAGLEGLFPASVRPNATGFEFAPYEGSFAMTITNGAYHHEPQWCYNVSHAEEAARGQDPSGDLFSPGWMSADLKVGDKVEIVGEFRSGAEKGAAVANGAEKGVAVAVANGAGAEKGAGAGEEPLRFPAGFGVPRVAALPIDEALKEALDLYIVKRDDLKTVIAGYPWFLDWGRDTFIFMRGMIAAGKIEDAIKILKAFAAFEENGTLPNIIYGTTAGNRDTTDAQLWFIRCVRELEELQGETDEIKALKETCESIVRNYQKGTPNGIRMDAESALVWSPSHFTWMDTNYPACTPREGYPVEIQALWISALDYLGHAALAEKARESVEKYFRIAGGDGYYDCLAAPRGESAANATPEDTIRPNQLFLVTLGVTKEKSILKATEELLIPGGIRSLNAGHPLYRGRYEGDEDTSRKPAYHNGTVWAWPFPLFAEALVMTGAASPETALRLLGSVVENLNCGCICHVSENADGDAPHAQKGCIAQAWSDSEVLRVWLKLSALKNCQVEE